MTTIAGMDLGYGSQVQIVKTNYLFVSIKAGDGGTVAQQRDYLELFNATLNKNQTGGGIHPLTCDYIIPSIAGTGDADPKVTGASATGLLLPVMGPSREALAQQSGLSGSGFEHASSQADQGSSANGHILAFIGSGIVNVDITVSGSVATAASATALDTLVGTGGLSHALTGSLLARTVDQSVDGGVASGNALGAFFPMGDIHTDLAASDPSTPLVELNSLTTSVVYPGNAHTSITPTTLVAALGCRN